MRKLLSYDDKLLEIEKILKANLNNSIAQNNIQKPEPDLALTQIPEEQYFYNLAESVNFKEFVYLEILRVEPRSITGKSADIVFINIFVGFQTNKTPKNNMFMAYRYESCIRAAFENFPMIKYENSLVDGLSIGNRALYGAMCTFSLPLI